MVLCLICKSVSHFEFIFEYAGKTCSNFIDLWWLSIFPNMKCLSFIHCIVFPPLSKTNKL